MLFRRPFKVGKATGSHSDNQVYKSEITWSGLFADQHTAGPSPFDACKAQVSLRKRFEPILSFT